MIAKGIIKAGAAVTGFSSGSIRTNFTNQLENWSKRDFIAIANGEEPSGKNVPPNKELWAQPDP